MNDIAVGMWSLCGLFVLAALEFVGLRPAVRALLASAWAFAQAVWAELVGLYHWVTTPPGAYSDTAREADSWPVTMEGWSAECSERGVTLRPDVVWPDEPPVPKRKPRRKRNPGK
jgi:hypothetical protein